MRVEVEPEAEVKNDEKPWPRIWEDLDDATREKAVEPYRYRDVEFNEWWQDVYEDAKRMGGLLGIDPWHIYFSGFCQQGDGACYQGAYKPKADAVQAIKAECNDEELLRIAEELTLLQTAVKLSHGWTLGATVSLSAGLYCHSGSMRFDFLYDDSSEEPEGVDTFSYTGTLAELLRDFADWIYRQLEAEHSYLTSDEHVKETLSDGDYRFDEDGRII